MADVRSERYLVAIHKIAEDTKKIADDISVMNEFVDVFPEKLLGLPSSREVDFAIDLVPES